MLLIPSSLVESFLQPVKDTVASMLGLSSEDEAIVDFCCKSAYAQAIEFCKQHFVYGRYVDKYVQQDIVKLRVFPVVGIERVLDKYEEELSYEYFNLLRGIKVYYDGDYVFVQYVAGLERADLSPGLHEALVMQAVANYNKRNYLGVKSVSGGAGTEVSASVTFAIPGLIDDAKQLLSNFVYYDEFESISFEEA